jgi:hypothetical protein
MLPVACLMLQDFDASMNQIDFDTIKDCPRAAAQRLGGTILRYDDHTLS